MKWFSQMLVWMYGLSALSFLYSADNGILVYFANKPMGHYKNISLWQKSF